MNVEPRTRKAVDSSKSVFFFSKEFTEGNASMRNSLGGKGANLAEMSSLGLPVPPGFTISAGVCTNFYKNNNNLDEKIRNEIEEGLLKIENILGKKFGVASNPLLVSVRSGARVSMPGMMDTILNLGLNDETVLGLVKNSKNERFAWDSYRRFIQMYSNVVMGINHSLLDVTLEDLKAQKGYVNDTDLTPNDLIDLVERYKDIVLDECGKEFPMDPREQLWGAIYAVFESWNTPRAKTYRDFNSIPHHWGTAVNIQAMVFGNMGENSATGVAFTRNPSSGEKKYFGEFLINAQGEDVVAGIRTPQPITKVKSQQDVKQPISLEEVMPDTYNQLCDVFDKLENHYRDMQDIEFTVEKNSLWMLQTRNGKRTAAAALKIALDMVDEGLISEKEALLRIDASSLDQLLHPTLDPNCEKTLLSKGLPASPGGARGVIVFSSEEALLSKEKGIDCILVRTETSPEDIEGMVAAKGILTTRGGMTSHAAVVARGMGKCCVSGCDGISIDYKNQEMRVAGYVLNKGDSITLDGSTGEIFLGEVPVVEPKLDGDFDRIMLLSDKYRTMKLRTNADTPKDALAAKKYGAEGIGLCRTEHMFFDSERIDVVRQMILAEDLKGRSDALDELLPMQADDFYELFKVMAGFPVTIRLLDPPLHEFLPHSKKEISELATRLNENVDTLTSRIERLEEFNPMLGHRGCRLAISFPEIYIMQAKAIGIAVAKCVKNKITVEPEIMIPLVGAKQELSILRELVVREINLIQKTEGVQFNYTVGTMIELPRAAVTADKIAPYADFFSFGTNDLTQTTLGLSRDDSSRFLDDYISQGVYARDPFVSIDKSGVGQIVKIAVRLGRRVKPELKMGICGEHGGDPDSIEFFQKIGLDYVSCSPYRIPIARLAAAQAAIKCHQG